MALEVIGAGLGRTGTLTLKTALEMLGFGPCHHMVEVMANPDTQIPFWNRAALGETIDWEDIYGSYRATVDWPGCHFYPALMERYPKARVILSKRDPERWYESISETILRSLEQMGFTGQGPIPDAHPARFLGLIIARGAFAGDFSRDNVIATFERHNAEIRRRVAPDRLLEFEASQGWEPLCAFLGVPVPDMPFPRTNSREEFWQHLEKGRELMERQGDPAAGISAP